MKELFGVIGDPISHSMSPEMHNDAFLDKGIDAHYQAFHVKTQQLQDVVIGMKALGVKGFNVTVPHKTDIIQYLDRIDPLAKTIRAVNTVKLENGEYVGYNTDGIGFYTGLKKELNESCFSKNVLLIGAGGAARAIYYTLLHEGLERIDVCNRTKTRAEELIAGNSHAVESRALSLDEAEQLLSRYSLIINTTTIGMKPNIDEIPLSLNNLNSDSFVSDIIYNPFETALLKEAKAKGAKIQNGLPMFIHQGALAFQIWTDVQPDTERMKSIVLQKLGG